MDVGREGTPLVQQPLREDPGVAAHASDRGRQRPVQVQALGEKVLVEDLGDGTYGRAVPGTRNGVPRPMGHRLRSQPSRLRPQRKSLAELLDQSCICLIGPIGRRVRRTEVVWPGPTRHGARFPRHGLSKGGATTRDKALRPGCVVLPAVVSVALHNWRERGLATTPVWAGHNDRVEPVRRRLTLVVVGAVVLGVLWLRPGQDISLWNRFGLGHERVLPAITTTGEHRFAQTQPDSAEPVGYNPCETIEYRVNLTDAPPDAVELVDAAFERLSQVTHLEFENEGTTKARPFGDSGSFFSVPSGVVIGWAGPDEIPELAGRAGLGGSTARSMGGRLYYQSGAVALDARTFSDGRTSEAGLRAILLHELAHVVGLAHVMEPMELMYAEPTGVRDFGPGDLEGLVRLGRIPCA